MNPCLCIRSGISRGSGGRHGLARPRPGKYGMMRLVTLGRCSGEERSAILACCEDGADLVTLAMNGWREGEPAWWLTLMAPTDARVDSADGRRAVRGRAAEGTERERLCGSWREFGASSDDLDAYAARRSSRTAFVVLAATCRSIRCLVSSAEYLGVSYSEVRLPDSATPPAPSQALSPQPVR